MSSIRFLPCKIAVVEPSGIFNKRKMRATVPILNKLSVEILSDSASRCDKTAIILCVSCAFCTARMDFSRPIVIGMTTPGNKTVFFKGKMGNNSGKNSPFWGSSESSIAIIGMKSASSSSIGESLEIFSNIFYVCYCNVS